MTDSVSNHLPFYTLYGIVPVVDPVNVRVIPICGDRRFLDTIRISGISYKGEVYLHSRNNPVIDDEFLVFDDVDGYPHWDLSTIEIAINTGIIVNGKFWNPAVNESSHRKR